MYINIMKMCPDDLMQPSNCIFLNNDNGYLLFYFCWSHVYLLERLTSAAQNTGKTGQINIQKITCQLRDALEDDLTNENVPERSQDS